ncbi:hypothetical protein COW36_19630 [bacterium (Candidatus Blackallbacteria) CG17_big_fil_post_rev_8_21_14_2_50_48_46]|uniref:Plasmid pRiA4b Orf3-like domain-containing protein n=1 Tax=bacterium (Candidatus Blackallbacteria) CG17_big_fil_post_rev_8_21_14_2_50_48_46 TaxID=2014261 RepID=A0A2M7FZN1_9BACT|nr:MAG: hypothetical protein COW64_15665 [bacterium (Candidatus Blackallbacteria) CG18_big_fil_WC_8_21_14_2_50_49_26]PIW14864.1 MAG: hypothetical protein COW36_19630 [bacterium (Candidatus Blackallbacteria) CG17_big_fil_post_rev_8_21_14_2_50_48_46]PIW44431.1 MAG: hypothetical protein COW20_24205 [bacterium (Candidatus Blackallbacteria) CG13_big_fil_rev_8_21_14_2_50_49_14]
MGYHYDFGDDWMHQLKLEKIQAEAQPLQILKAVNACSPEDCGGPWGYAEILEILAKKRKTKADRERLEGMDPDFHPESIDLAELKEALQDLSNTWQPKKPRAAKSKTSAQAKTTGQKKILSIAQSETNKPK